MEKIDSSVPTVEIMRRETIRVCQVPADGVDDAWPALLTLFANGPESFRDERHIAIVYDRLRTGLTQCWLVVNDERLIMCFLTEVQEDAFRRFLAIVWGYGENIQAHLGLGLEALEDFAIQQNCPSIVVSGRLGWERFLRPFGYSRFAVMFEKNVQKSRSN